MRKVIKPIEHETPETVTPVIVKVARTGGTAWDYVLNGKRTITDALEAAGIVLSSDDRVRVNGQAIGPEGYSSELDNGDIVTVAGNVEGGSK